LLVETFLQRRQRGFQLRQCSLLRQQVGFGDGAQFKLLAHDLKGFALGVDDLPRGLDLGAQARLLNGRCHDVRGQRQVGRIIFVAAGIGRSLQRFHLATVRTEQVRDKRDADLGRVQIENRRARGERGCEHLHRVAIAAGIRIQLHLWKVGATPRGDVLLCLAQRGFRRLHVGVGAQRFGDQRIQGRGAELMPPLCRRVLARDE
jgi:hypothetical protein